MNKKPHILMVAAENGALKGAKVGGMADVLDGLSRALAEDGLRITVVTPSYGFLHRDHKVLGESLVTFPFRDGAEQAMVYRLVPPEPRKNVTHLVVENIWVRGHPLYTHDPDDRPFASDASKFALFCSAVGGLLLSGSPLCGKVDVLHLHDWHTATLALLIRRHPAFSALKTLRIVFTIHNLGIQGTRPLEGDESSLYAWFPLLGESSAQGEFFRSCVDLRYRRPCYTPMTAGIVLADAVCTVSPSYAAQVLDPSDHASGVYGGEGMEGFLRAAHEEGRFFGILNGLDYPPDAPARRLPFSRLRARLFKHLNALLKGSPDGPEAPGWKIAKDRLASWEGRRVRLIMTFVGRVAEQKFRLLLEENGDADGLNRVLRALNRRGGVLILLGTGREELEKLLRNAMKSHDNFVHIRDYSEEIAGRLYASGHILLMPSLYEPCGLSQMLAMRDGQVPLVHATGGLKDTVTHRGNGFLFDGAGLAEKRDNMIKVLEEALSVYGPKKKEWGEIRDGARGTRFTWTDAARRYRDEVYRLP